MATTEKIERSADLHPCGADALSDFIIQFQATEGQNQARLEIQLDDGTVIDKAELVAETDDDGDVNYVLRLSGI